jgi:starch synthase
MRVLYVTSEAYPLIKTGGLGDVGGTLPPALQAAGHDVVLIMPAYRGALDAAPGIVPVADLDLQGGHVTLLRGRFPDTQVTLWLVAAPRLFDRSGNPYLDPNGRPWQDNAQRFGLFCRAAAALAQRPPESLGRFDIVHCNDWQSGLVPALLGLEARRPLTIFTVHNLAYQGLFPPIEFVRLGLPLRLWSYEALEFYGQLSFMKGGLTFADFITTVSPTYAREIQTPEFGCGLDGLLRHRRDVVVGILNGIDTARWGPAADPNLARRYTVENLQDKGANKTAVQASVGLPEIPSVPLVGMVGRLVEQKGVDLVIDILPRLVTMPLQLVVLGSGETRYAQALEDWSKRHPDRLSVHIGYDEGLAHLIEGGADIFLMPSRFEPCGLNQMYSLRYGTVPIVRRTGGLADTVVDATAEDLAAGTATGVVFARPQQNDLLGALRRALVLYAQPRLWRQLQATGMGLDFSWTRSASEYLALYQRALHGSPARPYP